jgi:predicted TIM-barrel fold metal-dependent hydrolase
MVFFDAYTRFGPKPNQHAAQPWTLEHLIDELDHCSISGALVTSTQCSIYDPMHENRLLSLALEDHENLFPLWNVIPHWTGEFPKPDALLAEMTANGVAAVTICPKTNGWNLMSATSEPLLRALEQSRTLTIVDFAAELTGDALEPFVEKYRSLPILLHGVHWTKQRLVIPLLFRHPNLHISFDQFQICRGPEWLVERGLEDQLLFASNAIEMSAGAHRFYVDYARIPRTAKEKIAGGNLTRLLKGVGPAVERENPGHDEMTREATLGKPLSATVYDMHSHILHEGLNGAGMSYVMFDGGPSGLLRINQEVGVDAVGVMSWNGTVSANADSGNDCTRAALDALPPDYWGLATFDVAHDSADEMRQKIEAMFADSRVVGFKPYLTFGKHCDDPAYDVWWEYGSSRGLYALVHPSRSDLSEFDSLCSRFPSMTFVAAHCGGSYEAADHAIEKAAKYPNFQIEITLTPVCAGIIDYLVRGSGADRVLYGSDFPMRDPRQQLGWVVYSRLSEEDKRAVLGLNAKRLISRIRGPG